MKMKKRKKTKTKTNYHQAFKDEEYPMVLQHEDNIIQDYDLNNLILHFSDFMI